MHIKNLIRQVNRKEGVIKFSPSPSESLKHLLTKTEICYWLKCRKIPFYCEAIFESGNGRADVVADYGKYGVAYEIYHTETQERMDKKSKSYPKEITLVFIKAGSIINDKLMN